MQAGTSQSERNKSRIFCVTGDSPFPNLGQSGGAWQTFCILQSLVQVCKCPKCHIWVWTWFELGLRNWELALHELEQKSVSLLLFALCALQWDARLSHTNSMQKGKKTEEQWFLRKKEKMERRKRGIMGEICLLSRGIGACRPRMGQQSLQVTYSDGKKGGA